MIEIKNLEVLVMDNGEVLCQGKTIGWVDKLGKYLSPKIRPGVVKLEISGGVLTNVEGLPEGWTYKLTDHDNNE